MSWLDRLAEAAYTPDDGQRLTFRYTDVSREATSGSVLFSSPLVNGSVAQHLGNSAQMFKLSCFFSGSDCDIDADAFYTALLSNTSGFLEHPRYGRVRVAVVGAVAQSDDLVTAANISTVNVTFAAISDVVIASSTPALKAVAASKVAAAKNGILAKVQQMLQDASTVEFIGLLNVIKSVTGSDIVDSILDVIDMLDELLNAGSNTRLNYTGDTTNNTRTIKKTRDRRDYNEYVLVRYMSDISILNTYTSEQTNDTLTQFVADQDRVVAWSDTTADALVIDASVLDPDVDVAVRAANVSVLNVLLSDLVSNKDDVIFVDADTSLLTVSQDLAAFISSNDLTSDQIIELPRGAYVKQ